ncbi:MAG: HAD-IIA family hydrolase [Ktedonobacterales bacterium]
MSETQPIPGDAGTIASYRAFLLDLDGVVYRGNQLLAAARAFVEWADASGRQVIFLSNNSFASVAEVAAKLARLGIPHPEERTMTAGQAAALALAERFPGGRVYALTVASVAGMVADAGLQVVWRERVDGPIPDAVLVGLDRTLTYERLSRGLRALLGGAAFYAVNRDPRLPVEDGFEPGTGAIVAALEYASGVSSVVVGKPAPGIVAQALHRLGATAEEALMIGDGLDLDIVAGHAAGVATALVLTGLTTAREARTAQGTRRPEYVFADLAALLHAIHHADMP